MVSPLIPRNGFQILVSGPTSRWRWSHNARYTAAKGDVSLAHDEGLEQVQGQQKFGTTEWHENGG